MKKLSPINIDPEIMSGAPVFRGTRVTIQTLFDYLESGKTLDEFIDDFDWISKEHAIDVMEIAKKTLSSNKILSMVDESAD